MTLLMDKMFIKAGLPACELMSLKSRSYVYAGILFMTGFTLVFSTLAIETILF